MVITGASSKYPIEVFYSYSYKDKNLRQRLETHLALLKHQGFINDWHDRDVGAGADWKREISTHLDNAQIILLLISADFLASDYCYGVEMTRALARHEAGKARVIPILLRDVDWKNAPFEHLEVLPDNGMPVTNRRYWRTYDEAFTNIATGIRKVIELTLKTQPSHLTSTAPSVPRHTRSQQGGEEHEIVPQAHMTQAQSTDVNALDTDAAPMAATLSMRREGAILHNSYMLALKKALRGRSFVLFIGNDLLSSITGLPSRDDLTRTLARSHGLDETLTLAEVAQRVSQSGNRFTFTMFLRDALDITGKSPQSFHRHIVAIVYAYQVELLISTAYDRLLDAAFQELGYGYNSVVSSNDLSLARSGHPTLLKLYGDIQQPASLVVTEHDHSALLYSHDKERLLEEVGRAFHRSTVLFLGYNLSDPDFRQIFTHMTQGQFVPTAYAVCSGLTDVDIHMWRDRGIVIIDAHPLDVLAAIRS